MHPLQKHLLFLVLTCLRQNALGGKIIDGKKAPEDSMQYMVSLQANGNHICGGFLVSEDFVVTAAHCDRSKPTHVVLGTHDLNGVVNKQKRSIEKKYEHPFYVNEGHGNDIMLLKLSQKVQLDNSVQTIPLPCSEINLRDNETCRVAGWGATASLGAPVHELRVVDVSVVNLDLCKKEWPGLPDDVICAGGYYTTKGFCQGDSGGPLVCNGVAVGIVSFNKNWNCNYPDVPNVYVDISKYLLWINSILKGIKHDE
ncbi:duodenase-1-like [Chaetodon trifascialis]|uniref:duodenase-1-like n=1 Tax=Chaetodon trifascialis TaxID=109706 RepID=UPI003992A991